MSRSREGSAACRVGVWGTFDLESFGDALYPRIARRELSRRLHDATVRAFAPFGAEHPTRFDGGTPAEPLGAWSGDLVARLAWDLDCIVIGGGDLIHARYETLASAYDVSPETMLERDPSRWFVDGLGPRRERRRPTAWSAVGVPFDPTPREAERIRSAAARRALVSVRDEPSRRRLEGVGFAGEVEIVPDPAVLLPRVFPWDVLGKRLSYLRLMEWYPAAGPALVVHGGGEVADRAPAVARGVARLLEEREGWSAVTAELEPCRDDARFAETFAEALPDRAYRLPTESTVEDLVAAIAAADGFVGSSVSGAIAALVLGRPFLLLHLDGGSAREGFAELVRNPDCLVKNPADLPGAFARAVARGPEPQVVAALQGRVDAHLDRVAQIALEAAARRRGKRPRATSVKPAERVAELERELAALREAYEVRSRRVLEDGLAFADLVASQRLVIERLAEDIRILEAELEGRARAYDDLVNTRTFRYTSRVRDAYGAVRGWVRRR